MGINQRDMWSNILHLENSGVLHYSSNSNQVMDTIIAIFCAKVLFHTTKISIFRSLHVHFRHCYYIFKSNPLLHGIVLGVFNSSNYIKNNNNNVMTPAFPFRLVMQIPLPSPRILNPNFLITLQALVR